MQIDLAGRRALVTGGTRGIGRAIVLEFLEAGARVTTTASSESSAQAVPPGAETRIVDLADSAALTLFAGAIASEGFDVVVNNAGINKIERIESLDVADWDRIQQVNVRAPMLICRALLPGMQARKFGRIVGLSSVFGEVSREKRSAYTSSKYALRGFLRTLAIENAAYNIMSNAVAPGFIDTELTRRVLGDDGIREVASKIPMQRLGTVEEVARTVTFLCSNQNTYLTGQHVLVDGGYTSE